MVEFVLLIGILTGGIAMNAVTGIEESKKVCYFNESKNEIVCWKKSSVAKQVDRTVITDLED